MKKKFFKKLSAGFMAMAMAFSLLPSTAFAATSSATVAALTAGVYEGTATTPNANGVFEEYDVSVKVTVSDGAITAIDITTTSGDEDNDTYINWATEGRTKSGVVYTSIPAQIIEKQSTESIDVVTGATCTSNAIIDAVDNALAITEDTDSEDPEDDTDDTEEAEYVYVTMNIPYADFYAAELNNDVEVDTVTSATSGKWKSQSGTYYESKDTGGVILGVQYPVYILSSDLEGLTESDSLSTAGDYAYTAYDGTPSAYKVASVASDGSLSFSAVKADTTAISPTLSFSTSSNYGDYQLNVSNLSTSGTLVAVIVSCDNGLDYGLRALENIWRDGAQLSWSCGIKTTESKGNTLSYAHYESMMTSSITKVTFITTAGVYVYSLDAAILVQGKYNGTVTAEDAALSDGSTTADVSELPSAMNKEYSIGDGFTVTEEDGILTITWDDTVTIGDYTLTVSDAEGLYVSTTASFTLSTEAVAKYNEDNDSPALENKNTETYTDDDFDAYIAAISTVTVNGTSYTNAESSSSSSQQMGQQMGMGSSSNSALIVQSDGTIDLEATYTQSSGGMGGGPNQQSSSSSTTVNVFDGDGIYVVTVSATGYEDLTFTILIGYSYVTMNIPYADFYAAEISNDVEVDTVTSATSGKWKSQSGTYYESADNGGVILGVQYPVCILTSELENLTESDKDNISAAESYAYYAYEGTPSAYKVASVDEEGNLSFGEVVAETTEITPTITLSTSSNYGDYQLEVSNANTSGTLVAVVLSCDNDVDYGLRALENIWRSGAQLSWSCGISTTEKHGNTLSYAHYESMMGNTIETITYYTTTGVYTANVEIYVPVKVDGAEVSVESAVIADEKTTISTSNLDCYDAVYTVSAEGFTATEEGTITWNAADVLPGTYTLTVSDANGVYADVTASFMLSTNDIPVTYSLSKNALVTSEDATDAACANYLSSITSVTVNGTKYSASGRDATVIINSTTGVVGNENVFTEAGIYEVTVTATGYNEDYTFTVYYGYSFVTMNIPYAVFYENLIENDVEVDVVTSATSSKWNTTNSNFGTASTYKTEATGSGGQILGIQYPVLILDEDLAVIEAMNLTEYDDYYYTALTEVPAVYMSAESVATSEAELSTAASDIALSFTLVCEEEALDIEVELATTSKYGDYQLTVDGVNVSGNLVGVILSCDNDTDYALRGLENIWKGGAQLSWSTGFTTTESHGNTLSYEHYVSIMGSNIQTITFITTEGVYVASIADVYVPIKFSYTLEVADADVADESTSVTLEDLPDDYEASYTLDEGFTIDADTMTISWDSESVLPGSYTLTIKDASGAYVDISTTYTVTTAVLPAEYNEDNESPALVATEDATDDEFENYISNITSVSVNGTSYSLSGRDAVTIINSDGSINLDAVVTSGMGESATSTAIFAEAGEYTIVVTATGYTESLTFTVVVEEEEEAEAESEVTPTTDLTSKTETQEETVTSLVEEAIEEESSDADTEDSTVDSSSSTTTTEDSDTSDNSLFGLYLAVACAAALAAFAASRRRKYNR